MKENFTELLKNLDSELIKCDNIQSVNFELKPKFLGKNSLLFNEMNKLKEIKDIEFKKELGKELNILKKTIEDKIQEKEKEIKEKDQISNLSYISYTKPSENQKGSIHIVTKVIHEVYKIFKKFEFEMNIGPEIEEDFYNFTGLNIPKFHPSRQMQDTIYVETFDKNNDRNLLKTHTTATSLRFSKDKNPPIKNVSIGKVYRNDSDKTHSPMFHQFELIYIDKNINLSHLKFYLERLLKEFFENEDLQIYLRPSFFPFTCPSIEIDINYELINNKIEIGKGNKKLEILGAGLLHPNVLNSMNIDSSIYSGIAFGGGIERLAMLKYGCNDIREFYNSDQNWLNFNSFNSFNL